MIMRVTRFLGLGAILVVPCELVPSSLQAQQADPQIVPTAVIRPGIPASEGELTTAVQALIARGTAQVAMRRYAAAERAFRTAAQTARREGHLPSRSQWELSSAYYYQGDPGHAAVVLEELAADAARWGDLRVEALALFNAAWLNGEGGHGRQAAIQVDDLSRLLHSPYMPSDIREHLLARLTSTPAVAVQP